MMRTSGTTKSISLFSEIANRHKSLGTSDKTNKSEPSDNLQIEIESDNELRDDRTDTNDLTSSVIKFVGDVLNALPSAQKKDFAHLCKQIIKIPEATTFNIENIENIENILNVFSIDDLKSSITLARKLQSSISHNSELIICLKDIESVFKSLLSLKKGQDSSKSLSQDKFETIADQLTDELDYNNTEYSNKSIMSKIRDALGFCGDKQAVAAGTVVAGAAIGTKCMSFGVAIAAVKIVATAATIAASVATAGIAVVAFVATAVITYGIVKLYENYQYRQAVTHLSGAENTIEFKITPQDIQSINRITDEYTKKTVAKMMIDLITTETFSAIMTLEQQQDAVNELRKIVPFNLNEINNHPILSQPPTEENKDTYWKEAMIFTKRIGKIGISILYSEVAEPLENEKTYVKTLCRTNDDFFKLMGELNTEMIFQPYLLLHYNDDNFAHTYSLFMSMSTSLYKGIQIIIMSGEKMRGDDENSSIARAIETTNDQYKIAHSVYLEHKSYQETKKESNLYESINQTLEDYNVSKRIDIWNGIYRGVKNESRNQAIPNERDSFEVEERKSQG